MLRTHVEEKLVIPGTHYIDPEAWDPLIMKFCEFFGGGQPVHTSRLATGWKMPHTLRNLPTPTPTPTPTQIPDTATAEPALSGSASA